MRLLNELLDAATLAILAADALRAIWAMAEELRPAEVLNAWLAEAFADRLDAA